MGFLHKMRQDYMRPGSLATVFAGIALLSLGAWLCSGWFAQVLARHPGACLATPSVCGSAGGKTGMVLWDDRRHLVLLESGFVVVCALLALVAFIAIRMGVLQRQAEEARLKLEESEDRFREFMDHSPAIAFIKDAAGRTLYTNSTHCPGINLTPGQCVGKTDSELFPPAAAKQLRANDEQVLRTNSPGQFVEVVTDPSGEPRSWLASKFPIRNRAGETLLGGVCIEITGMVRTQNALRESEKRYRQIVEFAGDVILRCDRRGRITYLNDAGARILQTSPARLLGKKALHLIRCGDRRQAFRILRRHIADRATDFYLEVPISLPGPANRDPSGKSELWLGQTIRVLRTGSAITGFQAISRDITARKQMETGLRASEERFRELYENGPVAYHEIDGRGIIRRVNRAACLMMGVSADKLVGKRVFDVLVPEEREIVASAIQARIQGHEGAGAFEHTLIRPDGRRLFVEIHANVVRDHDRAPVALLAVLLDVTQRRLSELMDRDRFEVAAMIAQGQPLAAILEGIVTMIRHQDESLLCIPVRFEGRTVQVIPHDSHREHEPLCRAIADLGPQAFSLWPLASHELSSLYFDDLAPGGDLTCPATCQDLAAAALTRGYLSCWSIPVRSSSRDPVGMLLVLTPRRAEPDAREKQLLESAAQLASIAMEHRHMTDLLAFQASHDSLTSLPNRSQFDARLQEALSRAKADGDSLAVLFIDLDHFKQVNDTLGHQSGDELLRQVAARLRRTVRHSDLLARIGGDEFSVLLPGLLAASDACRVAEDILKQFQSPFEIAGSKIRVTASIGVSIFPEDGFDAPSLQRQSDTAMYSAKNTGRNNYCCFTRPGRPSPELVI